MKKICLFFVIVGGLFLLQPAESEAKLLGVHLDATLGGSHTFRVGSPSDEPALGSNIEILPSLQFLMFSADIGIHYNFAANALTLRPGARLHLGWLYLRAAIPMAFGLEQTSEPFDLGILVGVGARVHLGQFALVAEANVSPFFLHVNEKGLSMPAEIRLGLAYRF